MYTTNISNNYLRYSDHQRILEPDWPKSTPIHTETRVIVLDATFPWWLSRSKNSKTSIGFVQFYCWLKNPSVWLDETQQTTSKPKSGSPSPTVLWWISPSKKTKITQFFSTDIDDQRILQSDWMRDLIKKGCLTCYLPLMIISMLKN